jgi:mono/diheme cytochrome c family protein
MLFVGRCSACHGIDGRTPTEIGRWLYPRASDLGSPRVQEWSDRELFWIIQNGIRLTGMPGFGKLHSDEDIWALARYVRSLGTQSQK